MSLFRDLLIEKKRKPYYCEVEYLESTGTQWIDTNTPDLDKVEFSFAVSNSSGDIKLFGNTKAYPGYYALALYQGKVRGTTLDVSDNIFYIASIDTTSTPTLTVSDGTNTSSFTSWFGTYNPSTPPVTTYGTATPLVGWVEQSGTNYNGNYVRTWINITNTMKVKYFRGYKNGNLIRDLIPVLDWNMTPCMYDKISGQLFYNQGSGTFQYGREIHYVEYIESTGTQYIDTDIKLTNNYSVELDYQLTQASQSRAGLFGALNMTGSNQGRFGSILSPSNQQLEHGYGAGNDYWQQGLPDTNRHKLYQKKNETYFDGALVHTFNTATFSLAINAYLGNFVYTNYTPAKAKYYSSRWWDGDTLVRDYKPAIDENGVGFWFDKVTHTCFLNQGTGQFSYPARQVEYLQPQTLTSSEQYTTRIDTGISPTANTEVIADIEPLDYNAGDQTIGARTGTTSANRFFIYSITSNGRVVMGGNSKENLYLTGTRFKIKFNETNTHNVYVNDTLITTFDASQYTKANDNHLLLFATTGYEPAYGTSNTKIYKCQISEAGTLVRNFIPVLQDGQAGMLDKVNNVFYPNVGTGSFVAGKVIESHWF